jgi:hypothetical protein
MSPTVPLTLIVSTADQTILLTISSSPCTLRWNHSQNCTLCSRSSLFMAYNNVEMQTIHLARFRIGYTLDLLIPVSCAHCFAYFCDDRVSCSNRDGTRCSARPHNACAHHALYHRSQVHHEWLKLLVVLEVPLQIHAASVFVLCLRSQIPVTTSKLSSMTQTTTVPLAFSFTVLPHDKVALAFTWLTPSFDWISHFTPYIIFRFNFENFRR